MHWPPTPSPTENVSPPHPGLQPETNGKRDRLTPSAAAVRPGLGEVAIPPVKETVIQ
ncbi:MAG: hypothetical protein KGQ93_02730 [Cyanobacteria bacterium REEB459]|nr:hypothetical protein [Cyanobacteria bacterium REEB459]